MQEIKLRDTWGSSWFDFSWPSLTILAVFVGIIVAAQTSYKTFDSTIEKAHKALTMERSHGDAVSDLALVITKNSAQRVQVVATLSPRGLEPLLAMSLQEVTRQLAAHPNKVRLAVVDGELADAAAIKRALLASLPASRIVVIKRSWQRETIGPRLLDRL